MLYFGNVQISFLDLADDATILASPLEMFTGALEREPLGLRISRVKTKLQIFKDTSDHAIKSVSAW